MYKVIILKYRDPLRPKYGVVTEEAGIYDNFKQAQFKQFQIILDSANDPWIKTAIVKEV